MLRYGIISCPEEYHLANQRAHEQKCQRHCGLKETFEPRGSQPRHKHVPLAESSRQMGLTRGEFSRSIDSKLIKAERHHFPIAAKLQSAFTGITPARNPQAQICLHKYSNLGGGVKMSRYDVDSGMSVFRDLSVLKHTLVYVATPERNSCLTKSVHIKVPVDFEGERELVPIHKVPHILFGRVGRYPLYIFFPWLYLGSEEPAKLTDDQYSLLYEEVTEPALARLGADIRHHIPVSFSAALASSKAPGAEAAARSTARGSGFQIQISSENIPLFWRSMKSNLERHPGLLECFRDPFFLYDCMNHKLEYREVTSLNHCLNNFWNDYTKRVTRSQGLFEEEEDQDKREYVDVAAEFLPFGHSDNSCDVLLAQRCCQYNTLKLLFGEDFSALTYEPTPEAHPTARMYNPPGTTTTEYNLFGLRDAVDITCEPKLSSKAFSYGLAYLQSYSVTEELFSNTGVRPFSNESFKHLPYSHPEWKAYAANTKLPFSRQHIFAAFDAAVHRVYTALNPTTPVSFGHRIELRVNPRLADLLQIAEASYCAEVYLANGEQPTTKTASGHHDQQLEDCVLSIFDLGDGAQLGRILTEPDPRGMFFIPYREFRSFLQGNINKHILALDSILAYYDCISESESGQTPQAASSLFGFLLLSLQNFISGLHPRIQWVLKNPLRGDIAEQAGTARPGLGLGDTTTKRGFMFWQDIVDWEEFKLRDDVLDRVSDPGFHSLATFRVAKTMRVDRTFLDGWGRLCNSANLTSRQSRFLMEAGVNFLLRTYRQQAVLKLYPNALKVEKTRRHYELDTLKFTLQDLRKANEEFAYIGVDITSGNRAALLEPLAFFNWLWTDRESSMKRAHTESLPFREHFKKASSAMASSPSPLLTRERFERLLFHRFYQQHSCVPYPNPNGTFLATVKRTRKRCVCCWEYTGTYNGFDIDCPVQPRIVKSIKDKNSVVSPDPMLPPKYIAELSTAKDVEEGLRSPEVLGRVGLVENGT